MEDLREGPLTEEEAARLWSRAAQLQAEAIRRSEASETAEASADLVAREGYDLEHVRTAAIEAGIGAEHFDAALRRFKRSCEKAGVLSEVRRGGDIPQPRFRLPKQRRLAIVQAMAAGLPS